MPIAQLEFITVGYKSFVTVVLHQLVLQIHQTIAVVADDIAYYLATMSMDGGDRPCLGVRFVSQLAGRRQALKHAT